MNLKKSKTIQIYELHMEISCEVLLEVLLDTIQYDWQWNDISFSNVLTNCRD